MTTKEQDSLRLLAESTRLRAQALQKWLLRALAIAILAIVLAFDLSGLATYFALIGGYLLVEIVYAGHAGIILGMAAAKASGVDEDEP